MRKADWSKETFKKFIQESGSIRQVIQKLGLIPAGGNYTQVKKYIKKYCLDTSHFHGMGWSKGMKFPPKPKISLKDILVKGSTFQSYKLRNRLFQAGMKKVECEECGWAKMSQDGRIPLELDHINGDNSDNRIENLRILCPNCHSLKLTHRGKNMKKAQVAKWYTRDT